jgi:Amt family ammonium transporter
LVTGGLTSCRTVGSRGAELRFLADRPKSQQHNGRATSMRNKWTTVLASAVIGMALWSRAALAEEATGPSAGDLKVMADTAWTLITAFLVFWMNAGFGCVEAGFCRAKNACNILAKNFVVFAISTIAYWAIGFAVMFGDGNDYFGHSGWLVQGEDNSPAIKEAYEGVYGALNWTGVPLLAKFFFQLVFAGTAATIVSGCVAERIHYRSFMVFTVILMCIGYPVTGHWIWGGGWLSKLGMFDFAGSTVVHSVGGWAGLVGILMLGPRIGKYRADGAVQAIPGHSMALAFLGGLILWLGWFGFNPGSTMAVDVKAISHIVVTTNLACAAGLLSATITAWLMIGKPDFSMTVNGALAGLVAITAPCAFVTPIASVLIGLIGGVLVVYSALFFDRIRVDDPVGALSVHLMNGIWGTLAVGLFANPSAAPYDPTAGPAAGLFAGGGVDQLVKQLIGVVGVGVFSLALSVIGWGLVKACCGLRVDPECEAAGLDISEMGMEAYPTEPGRRA